MITTLASLILFATIPVDLTANDTADLVELNHFYDEEGRKVFDQVIWYDWNETYSRFDVIDWRLVKCESILPVVDRERGGYSQVWWDGESARVVKSKGMRETWTQYDPELCERESLAKDQRRGLR